MSCILRVPYKNRAFKFLMYLVRFRVTDVGEASEPEGCSSRSLRCSVTRAIIEHFVICPFFICKEVKLLDVKDHPDRSGGKVVYQSVIGQLKHIHERSSTMKKSSIYPDRSQELLALFEQAGNNSKLMCVPIDYAKKDHLVMFCNGNGEVLRKPFSVKNSRDGVKYLLDHVRRSCRHRHIQPEHVFFG